MKALLVGGPSKGAELDLDDATVGRCITGGLPLEVPDPMSLVLSRMGEELLAYSTYGYAYYEAERQILIFNFIR